ncbi:DUF3040 domain-containing protein [Streptomyces sp. ACA25]|uniref:DUF3040 domain-containing protein n=1 Tax=Streptomyces sp. ACA25 TaxID=3022596 RepID=UPI002306EE69|nr:DUF3040 domain-containing protein [Streptomyces sp. ACA25]MDB1089877.1 DUF3040 domain-containing protein [Streptomyces sp. ACA25]
MPLSEHEQRMLEQMERALYAEDPKFATALEGSELRTYTRKRVYQAAMGFLVGVALLMGGMVAQLIWLSVVGFLIMLGSAALAVTGWKKTPVQSVQQDMQAGADGPGTKAERASGRRRRSVMGRIEERWQRRRDERDH